MTLRSELFISALGDGECLSFPDQVSTIFDIKGAAQPLFGMAQFFSLMPSPNTIRQWQLVSVRRPPRNLLALHTVSLAVAADPARTTHNASQPCAMLRIMPAPPQSLLARCYATDSANAAASSDQAEQAQVRSPFALPTSRL
jgi:hypothetical protein